MMPTPLTILHVMTAESHGGAETYAADAMLALAEQPHVKQAAFMSKNALCNGALREAGVMVHDGWSRLRAPLWMRWQLGKTIQAVKPDIIHCWMRRAGEILPAMNVPAIGWLGGYYDITKFKNCRAFVGVTHDIRRHIIQSGISPENAFTVHTFANLEKESQIISRAALNTPENAPVLLTLSRLHAKKGIDTLLHALQGLPECYAWIAGDGPLESDLKALSETLGVAPRVRFLGWRTDRAALLRAADICLLPSRYEPFGTVMVEAWAAGVPLIAATAAGAKAYVMDGEQGLLVPPDDADALSAAVRQVLENVSLRTHLIAKGRELFELNFTKEASTRNLLEVYAKVRL